MDLLRNFLVLLGFSLAFAANSAAQTPRQHVRIDDDWKFFLGDPKDASVTQADSPGLDSSSVAINCQ